MARQESDREDLLREATALVERAELNVAGESDPVTVGFRRDGSLNVYFGSEPVYQFNTAGELRRAFVDGHMLKAERSKLVELRRERTAHEVTLVRRELTATEQAALLASARSRLDQLAASLRDGMVEVIGQVPADGDVPRRVHMWLNELDSELTVANAPHAR